MRVLHQLSGLMDQMPPWAQWLVGIGLVLFSAASIYGRINVRFGTKVFSKVPPEDIRSNTGHIIGYTVIPVIVTVVYCLLLWTKYFGGNVS